jgi:hypothetical protein
MSQCAAPTGSDQKKGNCCSFDRTPLALGTPIFAGGKALSPRGKWGARYYRSSRRVLLLKA